MRFIENHTIKFRLSYLLGKGKSTARIGCATVLLDRILGGDRFVRGTCQPGRVAVQWKYYATHNKI